MKKLLLTLFGIAVTLNITAQQVNEFSEDAKQKKSGAGNLYPVHVSHILNSPENIEKWNAMAAQHPQQAARKSQVDEVGDERDFWVYNFETEDYDSKTFRLMRKGNVSQVWFEIAEINNGHLNEQVADSIFTYLDEKSNQYSYDPSLGVVELSNQVFGDPPNVDGDGYVDFLITDIKDGWEPGSSGGYTGGFFYGIDQYGPGMVGDNETNFRDVLYIDSYPGIYNDGETDPTRPLSTLSHEYQHLIHFQYNAKIGAQEYTFVNEAQSNFASLLNGYFPHNSIGSYLDSTNVPIFRWDNSSSSILADYGRAAAFASYMWGQVGFDQAGNLTQNSASGATGINQALENSGSSLTFPQLLVDWGLANLINDTGNSKYNYNHPLLQNIKTANIHNFDAEDLSNKKINVKRGGIYYIGLGQVENLSITVSSSGSNGQARFIGYQGNSVSVQTIGNGQLFATESGVQYDSGYIMLVNATASSDGGTEPTQALEFTLDGSAEQSYELSTLSTYGDPDPSSITYWTLPYYSTISSAYRYGFSNRFQATTGGSVLNSLRLYIVSGTNSSTGESIEVVGPGELRIAVYSDDKGSPVSEIAADTINFNSLGSEWQTFDVKDWDVTFSKNEIFHIVYEMITDIAPDPNNQETGIPLSIDEGNGSQGVTHLLNGTSPSTFEDIFELDSGQQFGIWNEVVLGVPVSTSNEEELASLPVKYKLDQNYPNPFNPNTTISFNIPEAADVKLDIFNTLGQHVTTLVNGKMPAGSHSVNWDAKNLSSGVYFYQIKAGDFLKTRKMTLLK